MTKIPGDLHPAFAGCREHRQKARPVIGAGRLLDEMPAQAVAARPHSVADEQLVILSEVAVVACRGKQIEAAAVVASVGGALEAPEEEGCKTRVKAHRSHAEGSKDWGWSRR